MKKLALLLVLSPALAFAAAGHDALVTAQLGGMSARQAGKSSANLVRFMQNREPIVDRHMSHFVALAERMIAARPPTLRDPTAAQAKQLFARLATGRLAADVPDDYCFMRADIAARMLQSQGFAMQKINAVATGDRSLDVKTPHTVDGTATWRYHVAPLVHVGSKDYVLDPSLGKAPMTVRGWRAKMHGRGAETIITGVDQLSFSTRLAVTPDDKARQLARSLAQLGGLRTYRRFRKTALAEAATR